MFPALTPQMIGDSMRDELILLEVKRVCDEAQCQLRLTKEQGAAIDQTVSDLGYDGIGSAFNRQARPACTMASVDAVKGLLRDNMAAAVLCCGATKLRTWSNHGRGTIVETLHAWAVHPYVTTRGDARKFPSGVTGVATAPTIGCGCAGRDDCR